MRSFVVNSLFFFGFIAIIFEPLYYFGCNWNLNSCFQSSSSVIRIVGSIWSIYCQWDPLFISPPLWLKVMCTIEVFIFGPLYLITAYGLRNGKRWLSTVALPFAGALFYSTVVYFAVEYIENMPGTNMFMVILVNVPWTIVPVLLINEILNGDSKPDKVQ